MNFALPPGVTVKKQQLAGHWVYSLRHDTLGELGRMVLQNLPNGQCHVASEVAGDPADPMTQNRQKMLQPISEQLTAALESALGAGDQAQLKAVPPSPVDSTEIVERKLMPCDRCGDTAAMLIFACDAATAADFEDYARKMYPQYTALDVPTWIIGEPLGTAGVETPSAVLKIWPRRESIRHRTPNEFNAELDDLLARHYR